MQLNSILDQTITKFETIAREASAEIFLCGGHGGLVVYDGKGGKMIKEGGPMDRIFLLRKSGELGGDIALDIGYGNIKFETGPLAEGCEREESYVLFGFEGSSDEMSVVVKGSISEVALERETILYHSSVEPSIMRWDLESSRLPYTAYHSDPYVHPALLEHLGVSGKLLGSVSGWDKPSLAEMLGSEGAPQGAAFRTQQHLGNLRIFVG